MPRFTFSCGRPVQRLALATLLCSTMIAGPALAQSRRQAQPLQVVPAQVLQQTQSTPQPRPSSRPQLQPVPARIIPQTQSGNQVQPTPSTRRPGRIPMQPIPAQIVPSPNSNTETGPSRPRPQPRPRPRPRPQADPTPEFNPSTNPLPRPNGTLIPRPRPGVNPVPVPNPRPTTPSNPIPRPRPQPATPSNPLPSTDLNPQPEPPKDLPQNSLPTPVPTAPENTAPADRISQASAALTRQVQSDVGDLMDDSLDQLAEDIKQLGDQQALADAGINDHMDDLKKLMNDGADLSQIADKAKLLKDAMDSLASTGVAQADLTEGLIKDLSETVMLAGVSKAIADAVANPGAGGAFGPGVFAPGLGPMGPGGVGPGGLAPAPGGGPAPFGPGGGPGGFAPGGGGGGGGGGPGGGPGGFAPGGGGGGGGGGPGGGPGGFAPGGGGGGGGGGGAGGGGVGGWGWGWGGGFGFGFDFGIHIDLWFGGGWGWGPIVCCPHLPVGHCCCIGPHVIVCGTGGWGPTYCVFSTLDYCGLPYPLVEPLPNALPNAIYFGRIVLLNPVETGVEINYLLADQSFAMDAGMMQDLELSETVIRFNRGPGFGDAAYTLRPGTFKFVVTENGLDLVKTRFEATLDNTANASDFHLLLDEEELTVPARTAVDVESAYPIAVTFSDGSGGDPVLKQLADEKTYTIGINGSGVWDLFPGDAVASGASQPGEPQMVAAAAGIEPPHEINLPE